MARHELGRATLAVVQAARTALTERDVSLLVACSGGADSLALAFAAQRHAVRSQLPYAAMIVDHGLQPGSAEVAERARSQLTDMGYTDVVVAPVTVHPTPDGPEADARAARYQALDAEAHTRQATVLLGHTLDDQAETVLFRLLRGSGLAGLRGMRAGSPLPGYVRRTPHDRRFVKRPFLHIPKSRLLATLAAAKVPFVDDPSNRDPRFTRPRLRELMPQVAAEGLTAERLALLAERVTRAEIVLYDVLNEALMRLAPGPWPEEGPVTVDAVAFGDLAEEIQLRMLDRLIGWTGNEGPVELGKLEALCSALEGPLIDALMEPKRGSFRRTLAGAMITLSGTKLTVERAPPRRTGMKKRRSG